jgi:hypothetical protein
VALDERVHAYTEAAHADNTRRAYRGDWERFERWCVEQGEVAMPASSATLARYLAFLADHGKKASTIRRARVVVGLAHGWTGLERPDKDVAIRTVERGIARVHRGREEGADALLAEDLLKLMTAFGGGPRDDRDRALILLGFAGAFRASELVGLNVEHITFNDAGLRIFVARSKEDQLGLGAFVDVPRGTNVATSHVPGGGTPGVAGTSGAARGAVVPRGARDRGRARAHARGGRESGCAAGLCAGGTRGGVLGAFVAGRVGDQRLGARRRCAHHPAARALGRCAVAAAVYSAGRSDRQAERRGGVGVGFPVQWGSR